jgi:ABC-type sugar transport system ATPase subunit
MKKLDARPQQHKVSQFLKYENMNLLSHLYNKSFKQDKMYRDLNQLQSKSPFLQMHSEDGSVNKNFSKELQQSQTVRMY